MVIAIVLLGLSAMTLTALGVTFSTQVRRTQMAAEDAQLRQLLLAGATFARDKVVAHSFGKFEVLLPDSLRHDQAVLNVDIQAGASDSERIVEVAASLPRHQTSQRLVLSLQSGAWQITQANPGE
jgi:hypothetical protein